ncbi:MAG: hypothetical protein TREMPRED_004068 [Tremellales sp. Tagirdzhanova-0007]|nr:MAG: hypothetical protein TREMPRED_004068 [Tremellales sp. Tagirdzhanova-0007]
MQGLPVDKERHPDRPAAYQHEIYQQGLLGKKPRFSFDPTSWGPKAQSILAANAWGYVPGDAGLRETETNNLAAFRKWGIVPNRLSGVEIPDIEVDVLGLKLPSPICAAPVGVLQLFHEDKELAVARACKQLRIPYILSTASASTIEETGEAYGDGHKFYQLYWPSRQHDEITISLLRRAKAAGYKALFVTLDTFILGWRPDDETHAFNPFLKPDHVGVALGLSDPVYKRFFKDQHGKDVEEDISTAAQAWAGIVFPGKDHRWEDLKFLKDNWDGPIVLKGIQTVADAKRAVEAGMQGIEATDGGRQSDGGIASLDMLPDIAQAVGDDLDIFYDSGIRTGADIAKALALGAKAVLIGRPYVYGLAMGGQEGVEHVLKCLLGDLDLTLQLNGIESIHKRDLNRSNLKRTDA